MNLKFNIMKSFQKFLFLGLLPLIIITFIIVFRGNLSDLSNMRVNYFTASFFLNISFCSVYVFEKINKSFYKKTLISILILVILTSISILYFQYFYFKRGIVTFSFTTWFFQILLNIAIFLFYVFILDVSKKMTKRFDLVFQEKLTFYIKFVLLLSVTMTLFLILFYIFDYINIYSFEVALIKLFTKFFSFSLIVNTISIISVYLLSQIKFIRHNFFLLIFLTSILSFPSLFALGFPKLNYFLGYVGSFYVLQLFSPTVIISILFYRIDQRNKKNRLIELQNLNIKKNSEYLQLKQQVNPHFLFNNLNTLISFIEINPKKAIEFGHHLSNTYRHYLKYQEEDFVLLSDEISFIKEYLEIYKAKFENGFSFKINVESYNYQYILSLSLQEIIDNIFKHNSLDEINSIEISIFILDDNLCISNSITFKNSLSTTKLGLENINNRYLLLTDKNIKVTSSQGNFQVAIPILNLER